MRLIDPTLLQPVDAPAAEKRQRVLTLIAEAYYADDCSARIAALLMLAQMHGIGVNETCDVLGNWKGRQRP